MKYPIVGKDLLEFYKNNNYGKLINSLLPDSPGEAIKDIYQYFGVLPSKSGHNISKIRDLNRILHQLDPSKKYRNALMIVAAHTHWNENLPIIIEKHEDKYIIGVKEPDVNSFFLPISFMLSEERVYPYEWAATSLNLNIKDVNRCIKMIEEIGVHTSSNHFGISINYRFKNIFDPITKPNIEKPSNEKILGFSDLSVIEEVSDINDLNVNHKRLKPEQISWRFNSYHDLDQYELEILNMIRDTQI